jgi:hypothetical protein
LLKTNEQQRVELENGGIDIMTVLVELLIKLRGQPHLVAQASVELKISGPTFRQWCDDMDINIGDERERPRVEAGSAALLKSEPQGFASPRGTSFRCYRDWYLGSPSDTPPQSVLLGRGVVLCHE